jgi:hypothetical protein
MKQQLKGKKVKGKGAWRAKFKAAAKKCAKGAKVRKRYTRKYKRKAGRRRKAIRGRTKMRKVGTIICRLK